MARPASRRLLAAVLVAATVITAGLPASAGAADSSNIPGLPWQGPIATGSLGGPIYDVVYSLDATPGRVLLISLAGSAGTDFDLYLFDSSAATVYENGGLVGKSTGPTSTEYLSIPSAAGGRYYVDLNGASDVEGTYQLVIQQVPDPTPPTVALFLDGGRVSTRNVEVQVTVDARDDLSGIDAMSFSEDGTTWTDWTRYGPNVTWTFQPGDGPRTLQARVTNGVGLVSTPGIATIAIDTTPPTVTALDPGPGMTVSGLRPTLSVRFSEPIDPVSWQRVGLVVQASNGALVPGAYSYDEFARTGSFVPDQPLIAGAPYIETIGAVTDLAGNGSPPLGSWAFVALIPSTLSVAAAPTTVVSGSGARLSASLVGAADGTELQVSQKKATSTSFEPLGTAPVISGTASFAVRPAMTTTYRVVSPATSNTASGIGDIVIVVRRAVRVAAPSTLRAGQTARVTATISPAAGSAGVSFRLYRYSTITRTYVYAASWGRATNASGAAVLNWTPKAGTYRWRVWVRGTVAYAQNTSSAVRVVVR